MQNIKIAKYILHSTRILQKFTKCVTFVVNATEMGSSEEQTKQSCKTMVESKKLPMTQKSSGSHASYTQIRYLMKWLNTALNKRLREGRPPKFFRVCRAELSSLSHELLAKKKKSTVKHQGVSKKPNLRKTRTKPAPTVV